jgi:hypothetical protein
MLLQEQLHNMFSVFGIVAQLKILTRPGHGSTGEVSASCMPLLVLVLVLVCMYVSEDISMILATTYTLLCVSRIFFPCILSLSKSLLSA